ncbi:hypothetical protein SK128_020017 [Halocaridina rubra]|uniref:Sushi domain-containing protein n=1 Tax=Halocaridina rubra TaxID=373956 RepID=A0AAN9A2J6_HALRR
MPGANVTGANLVGLQNVNMLGDTVNYTCETGKLTNSGADTIVLTFTENGWTGMDPTFICYNATTTFPPLPNVTQGLVGNFSGPAPPFYVSTNINYTCPENTATKNGEVYTTLTFTEYGWESLDPNFVCLEVNFLPPVLPPEAYVGGYLFGDDPPFHIGYVVNYTCLNGYQSTKKNGSTIITFTTLTLSENGWSPLDPEFECEVGLI